jgi:hypothetical protein
VRVVLDDEEGGSKRGEYWDTEGCKLWADMEGERGAAWEGNGDVRLRTWTWDSLFLQHYDWIFINNVEHSFENCFLLIDACPQLPLLRSSVQLLYVNWNLGLISNFLSSLGI